MPQPLLTAVNQSAIALGSGETLAKQCLCLHT